MKLKKNYNFSTKRIDYKYNGKKCTTLFINKSKNKQEG